MTDDDRKRTLVLCPRCGVPRQARKTTGLCADCRYTLTREQQKAWAA